MDKPKISTEVAHRYEELLNVVEETDWSDDEKCLQGRRMIVSIMNDLYQDGIKKASKIINPN